MPVFLNRKKRLLKRVRNDVDAREIEIVFDHRGTELVAGFSRIAGAADCQREPG
jgi:hypothetical protein